MKTLDEVRSALAAHGIQIGPCRYTVAFDMLRFARAQQAESAILKGLHDYMDLCICVNPMLPHDAQCVTLVHEIDHALYNSIGMHEDEVGDANEEKLVEALCAPRLDLLRRNPLLVEFLTWGW
jgi:hypothetical protein